MVKTSKTQKVQSSGNRKGLLQSYVGEAFGIALIMVLALWGEGWWQIRSVSRFTATDGWSWVGVLGLLLVLLALVIFIPQGLREAKKISMRTGGNGIREFLFCLVAGALIASSGVVAYANEDHLIFTSHGIGWWFAGWGILVFLYMLLIFHSPSAVGDLPHLASLLVFLLSLVAMIMGSSVTYPRPVGLLVLLALTLSVTGLFKWFIETGRRQERFAEVALMLWRVHLAVMMFPEEQIGNVRSLGDVAQADKWDDGVKAELKRYMKYREATVYHPWLSEFLTAGVAAGALAILKGVGGVLDAARKLGVNWLFMLIVVFVVSLYLAVRKQYYVYLERCLRYLEKTVRSEHGGHH